MRLNAIAHVRAQTIAARINPNVRQPGQPRSSRDATSMAASANGSAKIVCEKRTKPPHFFRNENIADFYRRDAEAQRKEQDSAPLRLCGESSFLFLRPTW